MRESRIRVLALHARYTDQISYFDDWLDALKAHPGFDVAEFDILRSPRDLSRRLRETDAVIALHSTNGDTTMHLERHVTALASRRVPLITFVGNELNMPGGSITAKRRVFGQIAPQWIATQLMQEAGQFLFGDVASDGVISIPHALNASVFRPLAGSKDRSIDLGTRVARYLPHIGDDDRNRIADRFIAIGRERHLVTDISHQRFDRAGWVAFLNRCKGTVSSEAGSWFIERDDATVNAIRKYQREHTAGVAIANDSPVMRLGYKLPRWLRRAALRAFSAAGGRYEYQTNADPRHYPDIHNRFFAGKARPEVYGKCISSRHFEAAGTLTCQIMFRGRFNDILEADRHYLALESDFSNLDEVLRRFCDDGERAVVTRAAHSHVLAGHTYDHRMRQLEDLMRSVGTR
ncbi:MAG: glycosyltransferase family protein [Pseudolabrys sp.]